MVANTASQLVHGPIGPRSKQFAKLEICASASIGAKTRLRIVRPPLPRQRRSVLDEFVARYVRNPKQPLRERTADEYESAFNRLVKPRIGKLGIYEVRRSHIIKMLDEIEDANGPVAADRTLAYVRKAFNWYATRDDQFNVPVVRGMARIKPKERARTRVLSDDEIRAIWPELTKAGTFGALVKTLLLTAQRRDEVAQHEPQGDRLGRDMDDPCRAIQNEMPEFCPVIEGGARRHCGAADIDDSDYVFPSRAKTPYSGFSKSKAALERRCSRPCRSERRKGRRLSQSRIGLSMICGERPRP